MHVRAGVLGCVDCSCGFSKIMFTSWIRIKQEIHPHLFTHYVAVLLHYFWHSSSLLSFFWLQSNDLEFQHMLLNLWEVPRLNWFPSWFPSFWSWWFFNYLEQYKELSLSFSFDCKSYKVYTMVILNSAAFYLTDYLPNQDGLRLVTIYLSTYW